MLKKSIKRIKIFIKENLALLTIIAISFIVLSLVSYLHPLIGITGDEISNILFFSRNGFFYPFLNYDLPNNHVLYSAVQSLFIHKSILQVYPEFPRILNVIAVCLLFSFFYKLFVVDLKLRVRYWLIFIILLTFSSPIVSLYFIVGRGYVLGTVLMLVGLYLLAKYKVYSSGLFFILAIWILPTFAYLVPFLYFYVFYLNPDLRKKIVITFISVFVISVIIYLPLIPQMIFFSKVYGLNSLNEFIVYSFEALSNISYLKFGRIINLIFLLLIPISIIEVLKNIKTKWVKNYILFAIVAIFGYMSVILFTNVLLGSNTPFIRNGFFIPIIAILIIYLAAVYSRKTWFRVFAVVLIVLNFMIGVYLFLDVFILKNTLDNPILRDVQYDKHDFKNFDLTKSNNYEININTQFYLYLNSTNDFKLFQNVVNDNRLLIKNETPKSLILEEDATLYSEHDVSPNPKVTPLSKLYIFKKVLHKVSEYFVDYIDYSKENSLKLKLYLADNAYAESNSLLLSGEHELALAHLAKAENYMTKAAADAQIVHIRSGENVELLKRAYASIIYHNKVLMNAEKIKEIRGSDLFRDIVIIKNENNRAIMVLE